MLSFEDAVDMGMVPFEDDRHLCTECVHYKVNGWKGLCGAQKIQYGKVMNRCSTFVGRMEKKEQLTEDAFWE